jgi:hypothetical protein
MVNGVARLGMPRLMSRLGAKRERLTIGGEARTPNTAQDSADPVVGAMTLANAAEVLGDVLGRLGQPGPVSAAPELATFDACEPRWFVALDELAPTGAEIRPRLPFAGHETGPVLASAAAPLPLVPLVLDPLTVVDDEDFLTAVAAESNLPAGFATDLARLYR